MPTRKTLRNQALETIANTVVEHVQASLERKDADKEADEDEDPLLEAAILVAELLENNRYFNQTTSIPRSPHYRLYRDERLSELSPRDFKDALRMTPQQFEYVLEKIEGHHIFRSKGNRAQEDVRVQLKVALHRLGHDGSLASYTAIGRVLDVSAGSAVKYTQRCVIALCSLIPEVIKWPTPAEKSATKRFYGESLGFSDAIGHVDGTLIPIYRAPSEDRNSWATRKSNFAMGATGVVDHRATFIYFVTGYVGSKHDSSAYKSCPLYLKPSQYFSGEDHLLGDAAYGLTPTLITRFKGRLTEQQLRFNVKLSSARVKVEHAFGLLKGRWHCLSNLRRHILIETDVKKASCIILACVVLHNILTKEEIYDPNEHEFLRPNDDDDDGDYDNEEPAQRLDEKVARTLDAQKRQRIMEEVLRKRR